MFNCFKLFGKYAFNFCKSLNLQNLKGKYDTRNMSHILKKIQTFKTIHSTENKYLYARYPNRIFIIMDENDFLCFILFSKYKAKCQRHGSFVKILIKIRKL